MNFFSVTHLIALIAGVTIILFIKKKYRKMSTTEVVVIIALYAGLVFLFTDPIVNMIKKYFT